MTKRNRWEEDLTRLGGSKEDPGYDTPQTNHPRAALNMENAFCQTQTHSEHPRPGAWQKGALPLGLAVTHAWAFLTATEGCVTLVLFHNLAKLRFHHLYQGDLTVPDLSVQLLGRSHAPVSGTEWTFEKPRCPSQLNGHEVTR